MISLKTLIKNGGIFIGLCLGTFMGIVLLLNLAGILLSLVPLLWEYPVFLLIPVFVFGSWYVTKHIQETSPPQLEKEDKFDIFN